MNIALSADPTNVTAGSDPNPGTIWQNTSINNGANYCDGGLAGFGTFRLDSPTNQCWGTGVTNQSYVPAIQVLAAK